jgi:hypothetical protein
MNSTIVGVVSLGLLTALSSINNGEEWYERKGDDIYICSPALFSSSIGRCVSTSQYGEGYETSLFIGGTYKSIPYDGVMCSVLVGLGRWSTRSYCSGVEISTSELFRAGIL